jgi:hypothetical protein
MQVIHIKDNLRKASLYSLSCCASGSDPVGIHSWMWPSAFSSGFPLGIRADRKGEASTVAPDVSGANA